MKIRRSSLIEAIVSSSLGCVALSAPKTAGIYYVLLACGAILGGWIIFDAVWDSKRFTMFGAFGIAIVAGYMIGPSVSVLYWLSDPHISPSAMVGPFAFEGYRVQLTVALAIAFFAASCMLLLAGIAKPIREIIKHVGDARYSGYDIVLFLFLLGIVVVAVVRGDFGYMGVSPGANDSISVLGALTSTILPALLSVFFYGFVNASENRPRRLIYAVLGLGTFVLLFAMGRRYLLFASFVSLIFISLSNNDVLQLFSARRGTLRPNKILGLSLATFACIVGLTAFYALRLATREVGIHAPLEQQASVAWGIIGDGGSGFYDEAGSQAAVRPGILPGYLASLEYAAGETRLDGQCLVAAVVKAIPRVLLKSKERLINEYPCTDEYVNSVFYLPEIDSPTTILTRGIADLGVAGAFGYLLLFSSFFYFVSRVFCQSESFGLTVFSSAVLLNGGIFVEQGLSFYLVTVRNLLLIWLVAIVIQRIGYYFVETMFGRPRIAGS